MGTTLTGKRVQNTYDSLLKLSNNDNLTGTAQIVTDGLGNDSPIYLSTTRVGIGVSPTYEFQTNSNAKIGGNLIVGGNLTVNGTTTIVDSTVVAIGDNMIEMAKDNVANTMDIGWYGTIVESGTKFIGMKYDAGSGVTTPEFHIGLGTVEPGSTAEWTVKGKLVIGQIDSTGGTFSGQITIPETPTADGHAASKKYVDDQIGGADKARRVTITVKNTETVALSAGTVVHAHPTAPVPSGNIVQVKKADYDTASLMPAIAILNEDLDAAGGTNDEGEAIMFGFINGIDTSSFSAGDELYVGNDGSLTNSKPLLTTQLIQKIAVVMKVDASNGSIEVFGAGRSNDVPNEVDRDLSIAGNLKVDDYIEIEADSGYGRLEIGGPDGGYIDLKTPFSDDYDLRIITNSSGSEFTGSGDFNINAGNTLTLTLDGTTQNATFAGSIITQSDSSIFGGSGTVPLYVRSSGTVSFAQFQTSSTGSNLTNDGLSVGVNGLNAYVWQRENANLYLGTNNAAALTLDNSQNATFAGDVTVSGGDIILGGTGRIQGIDTITDGTDAVNKNYVDDNFVDGSGTANDVAMWLDSDTLTDAPIAISGNNAHFTGNVELGDGTDISMDASANGQLMIDGNGYQGAIAVGASGMAIYHNSSSRNLVLGTNETARLTIDGSTGEATFSNNVIAEGNLITRSSNANLTISGDTSGNTYHNSASGEHRWRANGSTVNSMVLSSTLLSINETTTITSSDDQILTLDQTGGGWNYIGFESDGTRKFYVGGDSSENFVLGSDASAEFYFEGFTAIKYAASHISNTGNITPNVDSTYNIGTTSLRYANIYADNFHGLANDLLITSNDTFSGTYPLLWHDGDAVLSSTWMTINGSTDTFNVPNISTGNVKFQAPGTTNSILAEFRANNGNNAATFRTTDSGYIFRIHAQNGGDIYVQNDDGSRYLKIPNSGNNELYGDLLMPATGSKIILDAYATTQEGGGIFFREGFSSSNKYNLSIMARSRGNDGSADGLSINGYEGIAFSTGSNSYNERMYIDVNGKVRINNANASYQFNVNGSSGLFGEVYFYNAPSFHYHSASNTYLKIDADTNYGLIDAQSGKQLRINTSGGIVLIGTDTVAYSGTDLHVGNTSDVQNGIQITTSTTGYGYILFGDGYTGNESYKGQVTYSHTDDKMYFNTAGATRFEILSNGDGVFNYNLGVGVNPTYDLDVNGTGAFGVGNYRTYVSGSSGGSFIEFGTNADNDSLGVLGCFASSFYFNTQQGLGYKFHYNSNLRMTINTGAETATLYGTTTTGSNYLQFRNSAGTVQGYVGYGASANNHLFLVQQSASSDIILYNNGIYRVIVDSDGWTYFNNNNTGGGIEINGTAGKYLDIAVGSGYTSIVGNNKIYFNQNVGIYSTNPAYSLEVNGDIQGDSITTTNTRVSTSQEYPIGHYTGGKEIWSLDTTWTNKQLQEYFGNSNVEWYEDSTAPGGYAIAITGGVYVGGEYDSGFPYIPVDANDIYYMEIYMRSWDGNGATTLAHYMGSIDYNHSFSSLGGNPGSFGYWTMSNTGTTNTWQKYQGIINGFGTAVGTFKSGTKYWTPQALFNYNHYSGTRKCVISGWRVTRINGQELFADGNVNNPSISFAFDRDTGLFRQASGRIGFAMNGSEEFRFYDNGELHCDSDVVAFSTTISDQRLKDNVQTIENALDKVKLLRGVEYDWNLGAKKGKHDLGVIAQEVEKVLPYIVTEKEMAFFDNGIYKTVDYEKLTAVLIESVKELSAKVEALENKKCNCNCK